MKNSIRTIISSKHRVTTSLLGFSVSVLFGSIVHADDIASTSLVVPPSMQNEPISATKSVGTVNDVVLLDQQKAVVQQNNPSETSSVKVKNSEANSNLKTTAASRTEKNGKPAEVEKKASAKVAEKKVNTEVSVLGGLYVYVDEMGVPHYSLQKLDDRYQLFAEAGPVMDRDIKLAVGMLDTNLGSMQMYNYGGASASVQRRLLNHPGLARYEATIRQHASAHGVDVNLVKAVMAAESGFNSSAISPKNALGLMQVIPPTAARYGVSAQQLMIPERNIYAGVRYLRDLSRMFQGRPDLIIAAYNAGEGAVYKYNRRIPPYAETQNYVRTVMKYYQVFNGGAMAMGNDGMDVQIRGSKASSKRTKVVLTSAPVNNARRAMQRLNNEPVSN